MIKNRIAKIAGLTVGMTLVLGGLASSAGAQTIAELQAQINALMAQLATLSGGTPTGSAVQFNTNLTVGSTGADVTALQQFLVSKGFLQMPAGVAYGYFGVITKGAVARWQAANGISPAAGYFGPISRAAIAPQMGTVTVGTGTIVVCPTGYTCAPTGGVIVGVINTPGVEGVLSATLAPTPGSGTTVNEGDDMKDVLGIELEADLSDIRIERIKIKLDSTQNNDRDLYRDIADKMYVMDGSTVLASVSLNEDTVVEESSGNFYVTITGLSFIVRKDTEKTITIAIDAQSNFDSAFTGDDWTVTVPLDGIRGVDGAGVNQYAPSAALERTFESQPSEAESATVAISLDSGTPDVMEVVASAGTADNELDGLELLKFGLKAEDDDVTVTDVVVALVRGGANTATATTAYLMDGSTILASASVVGTTLNAMTATFDDVGVTVSEDSTKILTVEVDIDSATAAATTFVASVATAGVTAENSDGDDITESGSATGNTITVRNVGAEVTLVSKSITTDGVPQTSASPNSTSTLTATFTVTIKAVGGDLLLGTVASGTPVIASSTASFKVYRNGAYDGTLSGYATSTSYTIPSTCSTAGLTNSCTLAEGSEVTIPATFQLLGRNAAGVALANGLYSVAFEGVKWYSAGSVQSTTFMAGDADWRTADVSFP